MLILLSVFVEIKILHRFSTVTVSPLHHTMVKAPLAFISYPAVEVGLLLPCSSVVGILSFGEGKDRSTNRQNRQYGLAMDDRHTGAKNFSR